LDSAVPGPTNTHGVGRSPDAIDGYKGIGWTQYFTDHNTGETYAVYCFDDENGGKSAHRNDPPATPPVTEPPKFSGIFADAFARAGMKATEQPA
jgi:hypothetical protein